MSAVSVRVVQSSDVSDAGATAVEESATESAASTSLETFPFSSGNPRIERICGVVHLYRPTPVQAEATGAQGVQPHALPVTDTVCALGVPGGLSVADFCAFVGAMLPRVKDMRIVRDERGKVAASEGTTEKQPGAGHEEVFTYAVLMRFDTPSSAEEFFRFYHGRAFNSLEPDVCHLLFVKDVVFTSHASSQPPTGQTELPACPVCLERLDTHISGIITTVCNHAFHAACLRNWVDASCPVCRYSQAPPDSSSCAMCGARDNLWICLICGAVGCGRYASGHAVSHWRDSGHCYSLELSTQRVWDYISDGYVHRLIASKTHGHLVELTPPASRTRRRRQGQGAAATGSAACAETVGDSEATCEEGTGVGADDDAADDDHGLDEALLASKLDAVGLEYNQLLSSQLETQREYFQTLIASARADAERAKAELEAAREIAEAAERKAASACERATAAETQVRNLDRSLKSAERRSEDLAVTLSASTKELDTLRQWNETLLDAKKTAEQKLEAVLAEASTAAAASDARVRDLEEQLRDLAVFLEARDAVERADSDGAVVKVRAPEASKTPKEALRAKLQAAKGERSRK